MYEELAQELTAGQVDAYLQRIGVSQPEGPALSWLNILTTHHQRAVPFENLSLTDLDEPVTLGIPHLFDKIVQRRRGGMCLELNALFHGLLTACGYHVTAAMGRVMGGRGHIGPQLHRVNLVTLQEDIYLVDVGFGEVGFGGAMPRGPLLLEDGITQTLGLDSFTPRRDGRDWSVYHHVDGQPVEMLRIDEAPRYAVDFIPGCFFTTDHPKSFFRLVRTVALHSDEGLRTIVDDTFTSRSGSATTKEPVRDHRHLRQILESEFGIPLPR